METKELFTCCVSKWQKNVVLKDKTGKFSDKCHRHGAINAKAPRRRRSVSKVRGFARTRLLAIRDKNRVFRCDATHHRCLRGQSDTQGASQKSKSAQKRLTPCEKIRGPTHGNGILPVGEHVLDCRATANVNQLLHPWVTSFCFRRDTLSDEHRVSTAARWLEVSQVMLFTLWMPHLNLFGCPRLQRPTYGELVDARTFPKLIETPTTKTQKPKPEKFVTLLGAAEQSNKTLVQGGETQRTVSASSFFFLCSADASMLIPDPQILKPAC